MLILRSNQIRSVTKMRSVLSNRSHGGLMARGRKKKYTSQQKRKAHDIEKGYKKRGVSSKEAERRAWATVNKSDKGGRKKDLPPPQVMPESQRRRFRVRAAFFAAAERERAERCPATRFACLDNACLDAERRLSRLSARFVARERFRDGFLRLPARPFARSRFAWRFVRCAPRFGGGNFTPARRALDRPMAIACSGDRAPCSPSRMCSISSRTNSPA